MFMTLLAVPSTLASQPECFLSSVTSALALGPMGWHLGHSHLVPKEACLCFGPGVYGIESTTSWSCLGNHMGTPGAASPEQMLGQGP